VGSRWKRVEGGVPQKKKTKKKKTPGGKNLSESQKAHSAWAKVDVRGESKLKGEESFRRQAANKERSRNKREKPPGSIGVINKTESSNNGESEKKGINGGLLNRGHNGWAYAYLN